MENKMTPNKHKKFKWKAKEIIIAYAQEGYDKIIIPKGKRLLELWELVKLMQETNILLNYEKGPFRFFYAKRKKDGARGLLRGGGGDWVAVWGYLDYSGVAGRVVFI